jgi:N-acetyl-alpha-D-muramate 1-phosphate uridylyltransferase
MVLAAGMGVRMRPLTDRLPKPLVKVGGKALIDHVLDRLAQAGVERAVVNVHHFADQLENHLARRQRPRIVIADEREKLLGTGAGVVKALPELGDRPFFHVNSDTIWIDSVRPNLDRLTDAFDPARMDALLLLAPTATSIG